jgi:feruloyl-CoA synthase
MAVINTQRMWTSNQEMLRSYLPFLTDEPPILVSEQPWSNTFGGDSDLGMVIYNGGSLYIDRGDESIHTLRRIAPTMYGTDAAAYERLVPQLRSDAAFRRQFFSRLKLLYYVEDGPAEAGWNELQKIAVEECGECIPMLTGLGMTETAPHALFAVKYTGRPELVGVPPPGVELKLVPLGDGKFEARLRGPNVTPGYWRKLNKTRASFDEDGFFKSGVSLSFVDEADPAQGFVGN